MDGVITLSMPYHYRALVKVFAEEGVHLSRFDVYEREGQKALDSIFEIFADRGKPMTLPLAKDILARKEKLFNRIIRTKFVPGARTFLRTWRGRGLKMALVTGTARREVVKMLPEQVLSCFDIMVCGEDVKNGKPHPEPYQKALGALKVAGGEALVLENAPFGITAAVRAGLKCIALETSLPKRYLKEADIVIKGYTEFNRYILRNYKV